MKRWKHVKFGFFVGEVLSMLESTFFLKNNVVRQDSRVVLTEGKHVNNNVNDGHELFSRLDGYRVMSWGDFFSKVWYKQCLT